MKVKTKMQSVHEKKKKIKQTKKEKTFVTTKQLINNANTYVCIKQNNE